MESSQNVNASPPFLKGDLGGFWAVRSENFLRPAPQHLVKGDQVDGPRQAHGDEPLLCAVQ